MVTKTNKTSEKEEKKGQVKVGKLKVNKQTVRDLTDSEAKKLKGGARRIPNTSDTCQGANTCRC